MPVTRARSIPLLAAGAALTLHGGLMAAWLVQPEQQLPTVAMEMISIALVEQKAAVAPPPKPVERKPKPVMEPLPVMETPQPLAQPQESLPEPTPEMPQPQEQADAETETADAQTQEATPAVTQPVFDAAYLRNTPPAYPRLARKLRQQGMVELRVRVSAEGAAAELSVARSSGVDLLDQAALKAVRHWRFAPALRGDTPVEAWVLVPVEFRLEG